MDGMEGLFCSSESHEYSSSNVAPSNASSSSSVGDGSNFHYLLASDCFHHAILPLPPALFLFIFSPIIFYEMRKNAKNGTKPIASKWHTIGKILIALLLPIAHVCHRAFLHFLLPPMPIHDDVRPPLANPSARLFATSVLFASLLLAFFLLVATKRHGIFSSGILFNFWFLLVLCGAPEFVHNFFLLFGNNQILDHPPHIFAHFLFYIGSFAIFLLSFRANVPTDRKFNARECPEQFASFPAKITFWWFNGMAALGNRRPLEMDDLWELMGHDTCQHLMPKFENAIGRQAGDRGKSKGKAMPNKKATNGIEEDGAVAGQIVELLQLDVSKNYAAQSKAQQLAISLIRPIFWAFKWTIVGATAYKFTGDVLQFGQPFLMMLLIEHYDGGRGTASIWQGMAIALGMFLTAFIQSMFNRQHEHLIFRLGMNMRSVLTCTLYNKAISLSNGARQRHGGGEIVNLVSYDVQQLQDMTQFAMFFWSSPLQIALALLFLHQLLGFFPVLAGFLCLLGSIFLNGQILTQLGNYQEKQMELKDERLNLIREMLNGVKSIKLYAWEEWFEKRITAIRDKELGLLRAVALLTTATCLCWSAAPFAVALCTFGTYTLLLGHPLTPERAFVALSLLNILRMPVAGFATVSAQAAQSAVSNRRLKEFLGEEEVEGMGREGGRGDEMEEKEETAGGGGGEIAVKISGANFSWHKADPLLKDINLSITNGAFVAIVGPIGSGKSSLLAAMLNGMYRTHGAIAVHGKFAYVPQQAWILNMSVRENILFGAPYDGDKYEKVLEACALKHDLDNLPGGDQIVLGEKGANLSGGQRQRISLARAAYSGHDILLLDEPLSAVDVQVGEHIFDHLFDSKRGMLGGKTRIMVTHSLAHLKFVDQILVIEDGQICESGTFDELMKKDGKLAKIVGEGKEEERGDGKMATKEAEDDQENALIGLMHSKSDLEMMKTSIISAASSNESFWADTKEPKGGRLEENLQSEERAAEIADDGEKNRVDNQQMDMERDGERKELLEKEQKGEEKVEEDEGEEDEHIQTGRVGLPVYLAYFRAIGLSICAACVLFLVLDCSLGVAANMWLAHWADQAASQNTSTASTYLGIYVAFGVAQACALTIGTVTIAIGMVYAGRILHGKLLADLLQARMAFFDVTPVGRILNRFGKDIDVVDSDLPLALLNLVGAILESATFLCVPIIVTPWVAPFFAAVLLIYAYSARYYIRTSRQLKRMDLASRSPILSFFEESIHGATSIRAYNCADPFRGRLYRLVDRNLTTYYPYTVAMRWLDFRLDFVGNLVVFASALAALLFLYAGYDGITAGMLGLSMSYALQVTDSLGYSVGTTNEMENAVISVERIRQFIKGADREFPLETPVWLRLGHLWPSRGELRFENVAARYRSALPLALGGINAQIGPNEQIGIVGRTGAGKTTLAMAIFRLVDACDGRILIDGVDIGRVGLRDIRSRLAIVPQEPFLFAGTLQNNLDPLGKYSREALMDALASFGIADFVNSLPDKLDHKIAEGGGNLSGGQRQLVCVGRALLRHSKFLILDEVTAAMDAETDRLVQQILQSQQASTGCTLLKISHNIRSVLRSSRVMVMDQGRLVEFDTPQKLMANPGSLFHSMARAAAIEKID